MNKYKITFISIRYKLLFLFLCSFIIALSIITAITYTYTFDAVKRNTSNANYNLLSHISDNVEYILNDVHETSMLFLTDRNLINLLKSDLTDSSEIIQAENEIHESLINRVINNKNIDSIEIIGNQTNISMNKYYYDQQSQTEQKMEYVENLLNSSRWTPDGQLGFYLGRDNQITFIRSIRDISNISNTIGTILIHVRAQTLSNIYSNRVFNDETETYITDNSGRIVSSNQSGRIGNPFDAGLLNKIKANEEGRYFDYVSNGKNFILFYSKLDVFNWYVINTIPVEEVLKDSTVIGRVILVTTIVCALISILLITLYLKKVLTPLSAISRSMKEIEKENYSTSIQLDTNDEIGFLARSFNRMAKKLDDLIKLVYSFEIKQRDAQITILRSQMNPHFLYNVLDVIYWKSKSENATDTSDIIRELSLYLRKSIAEINTVTTVGNELEHLKHYVNLQRIRFENRIEFDFQIDDDLIGNKTINFALQPLVENSLYHGIEKNGGVGRIEIKVMRQENNLVMEVSDDGYGIDIHEIEKLMEKSENDNKGLAIKNINDRIKLLYGKEYGLYFERTADELTVARVIQPLLS